MVSPTYESVTDLMDTNKLDKILSEIDRQSRWADELAQQSGPQDREPLDSLRHLLQQDDKHHD